MKVGDLVRYGWGLRQPVGLIAHPNEVGTVLEFLPCEHAKETLRMKVLTRGKVQRWVVQFCEVINEDR
jgi:hypothetical protein